jgi:hypothetical protein
MATLLGWTWLSATSGQFDRRQTPFGGGRVPNAVLIASAAGFRSNRLIAVAVAAPKPGNGDLLDARHRSLATSIASNPS